MPAALAIAVLRSPADIAAYGASRTARGAPDSEIDTLCAAYGEQKGMKLPGRG